MPFANWLQSTFVLAILATELTLIDNSPNRITRFVTRSTSVPMNIIGHIPILRLVLHQVYTISGWPPQNSHHQPPFVAIRFDSKASTFFCRGLWEHFAAKLSGQRGALGGHMGHHGRRGARLGCINDWIKYNLGTLDIFRLLYFFGCTWGGYRCQTSCWYTTLSSQFFLPHVHHALAWVFAVLCTACSNVHPIEG